MADDINKLPQLDDLDEQQNVPLENEQVENLTSLEPVAVPEPSTFENQIQTEQAIADDEAVAAEDARQQMLTGKEQTPSHKALRAIEDDKFKKSQEAEANIEAQAESDAAASNIQVEIDTLQAKIDYAIQHGIDATPLEADLKEMEAEKLSLTGAPSMEGQEPFPVDALGEEGAQPPVAEQPSVSKVAQLAKEIKVENTVQAAEQLAMQDEVEEQRAIVDKAQQKLRDEDLSLEAIDNDRFWNDKNVFQKIGLGISMIIGGDQSISILEKAIERDIAAQKLNNTQTLAKRQDAYKRVNSEIDRLSRLTDSQDKKEKLKLAKMQIRAKEKEVFRARQAEAQRAAMKDFILSKNVKLEDMSPSQLSSVFNKEDYKAAKGLREEYNKNPVTADTNKILSSFGRISESAKEASAAGDLAMIFNFMKMLDPGSVVRESEFKNAAAAGALTDRTLQALVTGPITGKKLHENQRRDFLQRAKMLLKGQFRTQKNVNNRYELLSKRSGLPSSLIVEDFKLSTFSPREALFEKQKARNKKIKRGSFDKSIDKLIESGKLSDKFKD